MTQDTSHPDGQATHGTPPTAQDQPPAPASVPCPSTTSPLVTTAGDGAPVDPAKETTVWSGRTHWHHFLGRVVLGGIGICAGWWLIATLRSPLQWSGGNALLAGAAFAALVFVIIAGSILYRVLQRRYRLTGQRLFVERGILSQTIDQTELIRVDDVRVHKRLIDRILNMGTVEIRSTDATDKAISIRGIKGAEDVAEQVRNSMRALRSKSLFIENL